MHLSWHFDEVGFSVDSCHSSIRRMQGSCRAAIRKCLQLSWTEDGLYVE